MICLVRVSISEERGANCDCNSAEACLPSAVLPMAPRRLMMATDLVAGAAAPAAGADCAHDAAVPIRHAADRAADCKTILKFTLVLLVFRRLRFHRNQPNQSLIGLNLFRTACGT